MIRKAPIPSEHQEQVALFQWAKAMEPQYPELALLFAVPNAGNRHIGYARKMKAEGLKSGVPDLFLPTPRGTSHGLFIELKRLSGGQVSATQKQWLTELAQQGYQTVVARGWVCASEQIMNYLRA
jgi:hypothetical protein